MELQRSFVTANPPATCPKDHPVTHYKTLIRGTNVPHSVVQFHCDVPGCKAIIVVEAPTCDTCKKPMKLRSTPKKLFYWRCIEDNRSEAFEACNSCGGTGWLEMRSDKRDDVEQGFIMLGHDGGLHIERCDGCGHHRFRDDCEAERAHREECGCGHGLPQLGKKYRFVDYPGRNNELFNEMKRAGFEPIMYSEEEMQVDILEDEAAHFIKTLDAARELQSKQFEQMMSRPLITSKVDYDYLEQRALEESCDREILVVASPVHRNREFEADWSGLIDNRPSRHTWPALDAPCRGFTPNEMSTRRVENMPIEKDPAAAEITDEYMRSIGFRQLTDKDGGPSVTRKGYPIGLLTRGPAPLNKFFAEPDRAGELIHAAKKTLDALNAMNFQYHTKTEVLELESRRRGLLEAMTALRSEREGDPKTVEMMRLREASTSWGKFFDAGGYRLENLQQLEDEAVLQGVIYIVGSMYHIQFIQVHQVDGVQEPVNDPYRRYYDGVGRFQDEAMETVKLEGFPGDYVVFIYPRGL
jgi:hypothetical protein